MRGYERSLPTRGSTKRYSMKGASLSALIAYGVILTEPAFAQVSSTISPTRLQANESNPNSSGVELGDIVVTARRRSENLQETPIAVTALTGATLENRNISNVAEVGQFAPNVNLQPVANLSGSSASLTAFIRGVGQTDFQITSDPGVGVYVDGVYMARSVGALLEMADIESVEILRGPQGTLFGKNTIGGAILVNSKLPSDQFELAVEAATGSFNRADVRGVINVPLTDTMAIRAVASYETRDGYMRRLLDGGRQGNKDSFGGRVTIKWDPTPNLSAILAADVNIRREESAANTLLAINDSPTFNPFAPSAIYWWNKVRSGSSCGADGQLAPPSNPSCVTSRWVTSDIDTTWSNAKNKSNFDLWGLNMTLKWDVGDISIKSISSYRDQKSNFFYDLDGSPLPVLQSIEDINIHQFSQEIQINGSLFHDTVKLTSGVYYLKEKGEEKNPGDFGFADFVAGGKVDNDSYAAYAQASVKVTERLSVTPGIRYTEETKTYDPSDRRITVDYTSGVFPGFPDGVYATLSRCVISSVPQPISPACIADPVLNPSGTQVLPAVKVKTVAKEWTPSFSVDYKINDNVLAYASYSKGFKSGGFVMRVFPAEPVTPVFDPEFVESYEAGLKMFLLDRHLRLNLAAFISDYSSVQIVVQEGLGPKLRNAGDARFKGLEAEGDILPVDWLRVSFGVGYLDAYYRSVAPNAVGVNLDSRLAFVPEWTGSFAINAEVYDGRSGKLVLNGNGSYQSSTFRDAANNPLLYQPGFSIFGASASFTLPNNKTKLTAGVTNITDKRFIRGGFSDPITIGTTIASYSPPREWFLKVRHEF
ncbi:TonB-dependent receptor (plasmid) [Sphingobium sp. SJ10-10]|uniref:TonB-dependent receptor n=1 Tax=Sphingobium sp. SJ10-10 TaxID=3114999 RepID=UPI002E1993F4|nr:TonB-dependent receptor [Sphingobium sp. SJ10-10]